MSLDKSGERTGAVPGATNRAQRLRTSRDILATMRSRRQRVGALAVTHVRDADDTTTDAAPAARVAVIASKKVGTAVARNRSKRLLREAARRVAWTPGVDVVLVARRATAQAHAEEVAREVAAQAVALEVASDVQAPVVQTPGVQAPVVQALGDAR